MCSSKYSCKPWQYVYYLGHKKHPHTDAHCSKFGKTQMGLLGSMVSSLIKGLVQSKIVGILFKKFIEMQFMQMNQHARTSWHFMLGHSG